MILPKKQRKPLQLNEFTHLSHNEYSNCMHFLISFVIKRQIL